MEIIVNKENILQAQQPYDYRKSTFLQNLSKKSKEIKDGRTILFMKHQYLKRIVNLFQISIIISSTVITFFESLQNHVFSDETKPQVISICLSTYIAISTAIFKFIKIDDKKEEIYKLLQSYNDIENFLMNKIQKVNLLQDKFDDETKFSTKTPYILNGMYNDIELKEVTLIDDENEVVVNAPSPSHLQQLVSRECQKNTKLKKMFSNKVIPSESRKLQRSQSYTDIDKLKNVIIEDEDFKRLNHLDLANLAEKIKSPIQSKHIHVQRDEELSSLYSHEKLEDEMTQTIKNEADLKKLMGNRNFKIYLKVLAKYDELFQSIIQEYENEEIDSKILSAQTRFDALLSYNEIIYYNGKIVESMMLENVHKNNRNLLENDPIEELEYCKKRIQECQHRLRLHKENIDYNNDLRNDIVVNRNLTSKELAEHLSNIREMMRPVLSQQQINATQISIKSYALRASKLYMDYEELQTDDYCINNFFNNFCLFFSNFCRFCLIMKLYLSLTIKSNKVRSLATDIKSLANIREDDYEINYIFDEMERGDISNLKSFKFSKRRGEPGCFG